MTRPGGFPKLLGMMNSPRQPRVVSLIASATEIVCALGREADLVGRSHECDYPPSVGNLPICTEPKFATTVSSREIDRQVKDLLREALSIYRVDVNALRRLRPDLILTQTQCEVCAVSRAELDRALADWIDQRPRVVSLEPNGLEDVWKDIGRVAEALGIAGEGDRLIGVLQERMNRIADAGRAHPNPPRVACVEWIDPLMASGNWMPDLIEMAGGRNQFGEAGKHAPWMTWEDLRNNDPDVILVLPCGFGISRTWAEMTALTARPGWRELAAVQNRNVFLCDGNHFFNRPGPRLAESLEIVAEILNPLRFSFGHEGIGWERFSD